MFTSESRLTLEGIYPPNQWIPGVVSPGVIGLGVKLTIHHLVPRSIIVELRYGLVGKVPGYRYRGPGFVSQRYRIF
jgi:hypothetical protein